MVKKSLPALIVAIFFVFSLLTPAAARIGVGVGTGKIQVEEVLKGGMSYQLPPLTVLNTGDESSDYEATVTYHQDQPELIPPEKWFDFSPSEFYLEPGEAQVVEIKLSLPIKATPGDHFAYLEGHPVKKSQAGETSIGVAAAAKLYFTISPANFWQGIYYKIASFWKDNLPWTNLLAILLAVLVMGTLFRKFFKIQLEVKKKEQTKE